MRIFVKYQWNNKNLLVHRKNTKIDARELILIRWLDVNFFLLVWYDPARIESFIEDQACITASGSNGHQLLAA